MAGGFGIEGKSGDISSSGEGLSENDKLYSGSDSMIRVMYKNHIDLSIIFAKKSMHIDITPIPNTFSCLDLAPLPPSSQTCRQVECPLKTLLNLH